MGLFRNILLWMSENQWMKNHLPKWWFIRKAIKKFMPGETEEEAINAAQQYAEENILAVFTKLGENINHITEAEKVCNHYLNLIDKVNEKKLNVEISLKLSQLGFDISEEKTFEFCEQIAVKAKEKLNNTLFIDMEGSAYTQRTIDFYERMRKEHDNVGLCLQAYLYRTEKDIGELLRSNSTLRLVKGAYKEPFEIAIPDKHEVNLNYLELAKRMMTATLENNVRIIFATHDETLIYDIIDHSKKIGVTKNKLEFQMLYGIKTNKLKDLAKRGYKVRVLIAYGSSWYPWYMRRLAERPANVWFVLKNIF